MNFLHYNYKLMKVGNLIPLSRNCGFPKKLLFHLLRIVCLAFATWYLLMSIFYFAYVDRSTTEALLKFTNGVVYIGIVIRMVLYYGYDYKTIKIINYVNEHFKKSSNTGLKEISINNLINAANFVSLTQTVVSFIAGIVFAFVPVIYRKEPISLWYPYDANSSPYYELSHIYQIICQFIICYYYNITDAFYICVVLATAGQFQILSWEMENVCYSALISSGFDAKTIQSFKHHIPNSNEIENGGDFYEIFDFMQTQQFRDVLKMKIVQIIEYHKNVLTLCDFLENFLSVGLLLMFLSILGNSVFIMFGLSVTESLANRSQMVTYFLASAIQSFLAAFTSDYLLQESRKLQFSLYSTPWYLCPRETKALFLLVHLNLQRDIGISLGKFVMFDLGAYSWVENPRK
nr:uncharacterized protein LOC111415482 [Onthophagus taurus]